MDRRTFLLASAAAVPSAGLAGMSGAVVTSESERRRHVGGPPAPVAISSGNGLRAVERAVELIRNGADPLDAAVEGVTINEDDPADNSVGYGGLPNEAGVVELDACAMHGPSHKAGAVAGIQNIRNPAKVALLVLKRTNHVLLVGEGAKRFALEHGFTEEDLLTEPSRRAWLRWRENLSESDDRLGRDQQVDRDMVPLRSREDIPFTEGTIHCSAVDTNGDLGGVTSTSGLSYKIPGRVGDSPIIGAGNFTDNLVGSAGATGRGEADHQGTAWPWLIGPYCEALKRTGAPREEIAAAIEPLLAELDRGCFGQLAEVYDGDPPHRASGCPAQAWSVAEMLRVVAMLDEQTP